MLAKRVAIDWQQQVQLVLHEDLSLHRLRLTEEFKDQIDADTPEDMMAAYDADIARMGLEFTRLLPELLDAMGGEAPVDR